MSTNNPLSLDLNQTSLQDFIDCPRRFELSNLNEALWPASHSSPLSEYENLTEIGTQFHQLCQQFFMGIDTDLISTSITNPDLLQLWEYFLPYGTSLNSYPLFYEQILRIPFEDHFLLAKFDLLVQRSEDDYLIIDWKTAKQKPTKTTLAKRVQTFLYPYIFQTAGGDLFELTSLPPSSITMQYWYPLSSDPEEIFIYSQDKHKEVTSILASLLSRIDDFISSGESFPLTEDHRHCKYCAFRSYCDRSHKTSPLPSAADIGNEDLSNAHFDLDLIKEIEY